LFSLFLYLSFFDGSDENIGAPVNNDIKYKYTKYKNIMYAIKNNIITINTNIAAFGAYTNNIIYIKYPNASVAIPNCSEPDNEKVADNIIKP
jgi:thiamine kinase-like enzyme